MEALAEVPESTHLMFLQKVLRGSLRSCCRPQSVSSTGELWRSLQYKEQYMQLMQHVYFYLMHYQIIVSYSIKEYAYAGPTFL